MKGLLLSAFLFAPGVVCGAEFVIAERGKAVSCGLVVEAKGPTAEFAAQELRVYVKRLTDADLPGREGGPRRIVLSSGAASLGEDGFSIAATAEELRISGGKRGILYGVYEVLSRFGGVEWFSSWCEEVPRLERLAVPMGYCDTQKPAIPIREDFWEDVLKNPVFAARLRTNNRSWEKDDPRTGGNACRFGGGLVNCHTFNTLVPPQKYFKSHPEYFSEVDGRRIGEQSQLCLTNPDVLAIVTSNVLAAIRRDPTATCYGISQNDWYNFCTCANCKAVDDEEGSHAGTMIRFVNRVADAVKAVAPDKTVETLAYQYTRTPPRHVRPRDNVMVCLCSIECDFSRSLTKSRFPGNAKFCDDLRMWGEMTKRLYVWDYTTDFDHYLLPFPNIRTLQANIRFFRDNGVHYLFEQGAYKAYHAEFAELKAWLIAKWMWNPDSPGKPLMERFLRGYYGAAAPLVGEYLKRQHAFDHDEAASPLRCFAYLGGHGSSSSEEFLDWAADLWRRAEQAVADDPVRLMNVRMSSLPIDYVLFNRRFKRINLAGDMDFDGWRPHAERLVAGLDAARKAGRPVMFCESPVKHAAQMAVLTNALAGAVERIGDGRSLWQEEKAFSFTGTPREGQIVDDGAASGGQALWLANNNYDWYTTFSLKDVAFAPGEDYVLSVRLRAKPTGHPGEIVRIGIHDPADPKGGGIRSLRAKDLRGDGYVEYDVLTWRPSASQMIYIASGLFDKKTESHSSAHEGIWIDGFRITASHALSAAGLIEAEILARAKGCPVTEQKPRDILVTDPDYVVYVPRQPGNRKLMDPKRVGNSYNDHFQVVWDEMRKLYYAFWTQASWEGAGDHHICFSKSADKGRTWSQPICLAGSLRRACKGIDASWQQPMLSKSGRLYCLWNYLYDGGYRLYGFYSDDAGETWSDPKHLNYTLPSYGKFRGWINWQRPLRLGTDGRYFVGSSLYDGVEFWEFDNIDDNPEMQDIRITYLAREKGARLGGERMLSEKPYYLPGGHKNPILAEASVVKLPDRRLFALMRSSVGHPIWSESRDQGRSWSEPKILRTKDGGRKFLHPCSPCPIYDHAGCEAGSGRYFAFIHDTFDFTNTNTHYQVRGPYFLIAGKFNPKASQPIEFSDPKPFAGRTDVWNSFYTSYTVVDGKGVLWYPDGKYYLLGREIGEKWFK